MKRLKRIFRWTAIVLVVLTVALSLTVMARQNLKYSAPYPDIKASKDTAIVARGKHLVFSSAHCVNCHNNNNPDSLMALGSDVPLSGGVLFDLPLGKIYSKNITPDNETGIGKFSDGEIARVLRYGVHPDGSAVYDFMPFHNMSDEDLTAVISYLRTQKPVKNNIPPNQLNILGNVVKAFMVKPVGPKGDVPSSVARDTTASYGQYLAVSVAECNGCHTMRNIAGNFTGEPFAGGNNIDGFVTPNLTPDSTGRIFKWSEDNFIERFRMGKLIPGSPMPWNTFKNMTDDELRAIYKFLRSVKPVKTKKIK